MPDRHGLMAQFTMRTTAQYKVVDKIAAGFKMAIWDFADYMGMWIAFPQPKTKPRRRSQKPLSEAAGRGCRWHIASRCMVVGRGIANTTANERFNADMLACAGQSASPT
jgi:hypothetical protein